MSHARLAVPSAASHVAVMWCRREVLKDAALDARPNRAVGEARERQHAQASTVVDPAVPMFHSKVPPEIRSPGVKVNARLST